MGRFILIESPGPVKQRGRSISRIARGSDNWPATGKRLQTKCEEINNNRKLLLYIDLQR